MSRLGRWIDFKNDYKTLYPWFMESVWWAFKQLFTKGFVYKGVKVMPYSTACNTPLSNFESNQNYKETVDPAGVVCSFDWFEFKSLLFQSLLVSAWIVIQAWWSWLGQQRHGRFPAIWVSASIQSWITLKSKVFEKYGSDRLLNGVIFRSKT